MRRFLIFVPVGAACWWGFQHFRPRADSPWRALPNGVQSRTLHLHSRFGSASIEAFRAPASAFRVAGGDTLSAAGWLRKTRACVVVNGGYFDGQGQPMGLRVGKNTTKSKMRRADWGVFWVKNGVAHLSHTREFSSALAPDEAIQCGPRLVVGGVVTRLKPQWARRTGVGIDAQGRVIIAVSGDELSLDEWARLWASPTGLGCTDALNMDGGPSTQLAVSGQSDLDVAGGWPVPDVLAFK